ncbi:23S rRNA (guanosine(2251)-2'-O)-methyltransferase RlmB [Raineyella fluvialis]|uniref:23S rRNA (Guanosine(2251)-2'-O)-methyltransferase RlmB n=1 Tax=Raineyella fluvialis TaxID=2662261 RepID=A0A5Q2FFU0_9ACTN|nr:23S rRNA (guanosine(2251)-2'-O)-methyltransferase RlmB [Raineyella fluvialis]QGF23993.1 23S rRNA (guanosine(2251)-2'-O)-methyltransferase RlmB [Raineyella fluvialis]
MAGNSQRRGAVRHKGKSNTAGSGGRARKGLEGKGPTPRAEDRVYHKAYKAKQLAESREASRPKRTQQSAPRGGGAEWVAGRNPVVEALRAGIPVVSVYVAEGIDRDDRVREVFKICAEKSIPMLATTKQELDRFTAGATHQGLAIKLPEYEYAFPADLMADALQAPGTPLVVALDQVTDPRNLGAIIRSAAAFGAQGVVIPERRSAGMTAAAWKTSAGAAARIPVARATNLNRVLQDYAKAGFVVVGLAGEGETDIAAIPGVDGPVLLVVGSEGEGLQRLVRENCDVLASIPISSEVESLNAGVATSIALYEISRARAGPSGADSAGV